MKEIEKGDIIMNTTAVDFWKKFLLKCFIISFVLHIICFALWFMMRGFIFPFAHNIFEVDKASFNMLMLNFMVISKYIIFYVFLTPALALYWLAKCQKADWKKNIKLDED